MAFFIGLPNKLAQYLFALILICLPVSFFVPFIAKLLRRIFRPVRKKSSWQLALWQRCLCVLLAYLMLISPEALVSVAEASSQYSQISTTNWATNKYIEYQYDDNGSVTRKLTTVTSPSSEIERIVYEYNLRNKLIKVTTTPYDGSGNPITAQIVVTEYVYNTDGIRVEKMVTTSTETNKTDYLIDSYNPTGYAQVLEETKYDYSNPANPVPQNRIQYTIGDDVIAQTTDGATEYLIYDGHGSTRQLILLQRLLPI